MQFLNDIPIKKLKLFNNKYQYFILELNGLSNNIIDFGLFDSKFYFYLKQENIDILIGDFTIACNNEIIMYFDESKKGIYISNNVKYISIINDISRIIREQGFRNDTSYPNVKFTPNKFNNIVNYHEININDVDDIDTKLKAAIALI